LEVPARCALEHAVVVEGLGGDGCSRLARRIIEDKPANLTDTCWTEGKQIANQGTCRALFAYYANPRITAGLTFANGPGGRPLGPVPRSKTIKS